MPVFAAAWMISGTALIATTAWLSVSAYLLALWYRYAFGKVPAARRCWIAGALVLAVHLYLAMDFAHHWSLASAKADTARQTVELLGVDAGEGVYANFFFVLLWLLDAGWWWLNPPSYLARPRWLAVSVEVFAAVMFFNAAVVFATGPLRWISAVSMLLLVLVILWRRRTSASA